MINFPWKNLNERFKNKEYYKNLNDFLDLEYSNKIIHPSKENIFRAFNLLDEKNIKVIIFGQDPYYTPNTANGLAFSVNKGNKLPQSLKNIYKEIEIEINKNMNYLNGDLTYLAKQGVLLLNTVFSVRENEPLSHNIKEYKFLIKDILEYIDSFDQPIVFMLWGGNAKKYKKLITNKNRLILECNHPSPLSANKGGWFNCNHFKLANEFLRINNCKEINWINN